ncbi:MAG: hypothetical protein JNJ75_00270 [Cyclobacteriaceae bacterium]|nr:hypothetical protein [Cyclobacteriaceae bacterium]
MIEAITQQLFEASQSRLACRIQMRGEPLSRVIHPYGICSTSTDKIMLVCWQSLGFTSATGKPGYRNLSLMDCESVEILDQHFTVDAGFNPDDKQYCDWVYHV